MVTKIPKRSCFWTPFSSQRVNGSQTLLKSARQYFYPILTSFWDKLHSKGSLLVRSEILGLFVNTLITDDNFSRSNMETFQQPIGMQLSKKNKIVFSNFYCVFQICIKFPTFLKKYGTHSWSISEMIYSETRGYLSV